MSRYSGGGSAFQEQAGLGHTRGSLAASMDKKVIAWTAVKDITEISRTVSAGVHHVALEPNVASSPSLCSSAARDVASCAESLEP